MFYLLPKYFKSMCLIDLRLGPSLLVWSGGQLNLSARSGSALWSSIYCRRCRRLGRSLQQSDSLGFGATTTDTLAHRQGWQGVGQSVWGLHGGRGAVGRWATCSEGDWCGRHGSVERTREGNWKRQTRRDKNIYCYSFCDAQGDCIALKWAAEEICFVLSESSWDWQVLCIQPLLTMKSESRVTNPQRPAC